jgi:6-phosphogluconolactonase
MLLVGSTNADVNLSCWRLENDGNISFVTEFHDSSCKNVSWLERSRKGRFFATNECAGTVSAFDINVTNDEEYKICDQSTCGAYGKDPTHLALYKDEGKSVRLAVANYSSGSVTIFTQEDTELTPVTTLNQNPGDGLRCGHAHHCLVNADKGLLYVCDFGVDTVFTYALNKTVTLQTELHLPAGSGPRHAILSACGSWLYIACELSNQLVTVSVDPASGYPLAGSERYYSTMPADADTGDMAVAEILLSADGRFVYISNRDIRPVVAGGVDRSSIAVFSLQESGGRAELIQCVYAGGRHPRHMCFVQGGALLLVAHRDSHSVAAFPVDVSLGLLNAASVVMTSLAPHCRDPGFIMEVSL